MQAIHTKLAPEAIGPYSQAIQCGELIYLAGQIALDPQTQKLCSEDIKLQITQVLENLSAVCEAAGGSLSKIVKLSVYLTDLNYVPLVNEAMTRYFVEPYPARVLIGVAALPRSAKVEMDGIMSL
jgi:reactive intermediate/imine deaminase